MENYFDLAFLGAGISTTYTLINLLENLEGKFAVTPDQQERPVRIAVLEKSYNVFTGMPYGSASAETALIITPLRDFLPEDEKEKFIVWLELNKVSLLAKIQEDIKSEDSLLKRIWTVWLEDNLPFIAVNNWNDLCLPRRWFGKYIEERVENLLAKYKQAGLITLDIIHAEVLSVKKEGSGDYHLSCISTNGTRLSFESHHVVLAIGSPPQFKLEPYFDQNLPTFSLIEDAYAPTFSETLRTVVSAMGHDTLPEKKNVLVVGTNASALELVYHLKPNLKETDTIFLLSTDANLPRLIGHVNGSIIIPSPELDKLNDFQEILAEQIFTALSYDTLNAKAAGYNITDINSQLTKRMGGLLARLSVKEQFIYFEQFGMKTTKMMRRAGKEYRLPLDELQNRGRLKLVAGRYRSMFKNDAGEVKIRFVDKDKKEQILEASHISAIINCRGSEPVNRTSSSLINSLLVAGLARVTSNNLGLVINDCYESSHNLYVIGPLLAGNINTVINSWHVESAGRISLLARPLAQILSERLWPDQVAQVQHESASAYKKTA